MPNELSGHTFSEMTDPGMLRTYLDANEGHREAYVFSLGDRGFFAELTSVARAMIYAWSHELRLLLDSEEFAYRYQKGFCDYFLPLCGEPKDAAPESILERVRFTHSGLLPPYERLRSFQPHQLRFGSLELDHFQYIMRHFMRLLFRLSHECQMDVDRLREPLALPADYVALHIRRGDKIGDEDVLYETTRYLDALGPSGSLGDRPVFVMGDDYRAVIEVKEQLSARGLANRVATLVRPEHTGFDVWALRAGKTFAGGDRGFEHAEARRRYIYEETIRLLAETVIATGASRVVSTRGSNVGKAIWYLHDAPERCQLLADQPIHPTHPMSSGKSLP